MNMRNYPRTYYYSYFWVSLVISEFDVVNAFNYLFIYLFIFSVLTSGIVRYGEVLAYNVAQ